MKNSAQEILASSLLVSSLKSQACGNLLRAGRTYEELLSAVSSLSPRTAEEWSPDYDLQTWESAWEHAVRMSDSLYIG